MNVLSLFSGIGGLDLGLERAGMTIVGQVEIDPWCRTILAKHWPEVPRHDDVRTAAGWWGSRPVDLVCGGFPCQPVSLAGKGKAQADSRWLWPAFAQVIRDLRPAWVLVENVPGLLGRGMGDVLGDLAELGYDAEWDGVPAAFVGAPHIRNRVWIVAYPNGEQHQSGTSSHGRTATPLLPVADTKGQCGQLRTAETQRPRGPASPSPDVAYTDCEELRVRPGGVPAPPRTAESKAPERERLRADARHGRPPLADATSERRSSRIFARPDLVNDRPQPAHSHAGTRRDHDWWPAEPDVGRVAHGIPRRVDRLRGLGNAVVPQVAEHIGRLIMNAAAS